MKTEKDANYLLLTVLAVAVFGANGATFNLKTGLTDIPTKWESPSSYIENAKPVTGDIVVIPDNTTAYVDDDTIAFVGQLKRIQTTGSNKSVVNFNISTNATVGCAINHQNTSFYQGTIQKEGLGILDLTTTDVDYGNLGKNNFYSTLHIKSGGLRMTAPSDILNLQRIEIEKDGTLFMDTGKDITCISLSGAGTVKNEAGTGVYLYVGTGDKKTEEAPYVFSGCITGDIHLVNRHYVYYTSTDSTFRAITMETLIDDFTKGGIIGVAKIGRLGEPSSIGTNNVAFKSGRMLYLGNEAETTDKKFNLGGHAFPLMFDGGAYGGVTFAGKWYLSEDKAMRHFILAGDGGECILDNDMNQYSPGGTNYVAHITKRGKGSWRFASGHSRSLVGAVSVEEGTVRYESMAQAGTDCSLGTATELDNAGEVGYAFLLGGGTSATPTTGTLAYCGPSNFWVNSRKISITTSGRLTAENDGVVKWHGIDIGGDVGPKSLVLGGDGMGENTVYDLADGADRPLSVIKEDSGSWTLSGDLTFSGELAVRGGTLNVIAAPIGTPYSYYRLTLMENVYNCSRYSEVSKVNADKMMYQLQEFGLYDENGNRQNVFLPPFTNIMFNALQPGQAAFDNDKFYKPDSPGRYLCRLFDGKSYDAALGIGYGGFEVRMPAQPSLADSNSWAAIVIRLTNATPVIASYDICNYLGTGHTSNPGRAVTAYTLDGGVDGVHWERVVEDLEAEVPSGDSKWYSSPTLGIDKDTIGENGRSSLMFGDNRLGTVTNAFSTLSNVSHISVVSGGVLRATAPVPLKPGVTLTVDVSNGGALEGFVLPSSGCLSMDGLFDAQIVELPITFAGTEGLNNVCGWSLQLNGKLNTTRAIIVKNGRIFITKKGLTVIVR